MPATELAEELVDGGEALTDLELNVVALTWAHDTSRPIDVVSVDELSGDRLAMARHRQVATTSGLVAMKCAAIPLRASTRPEKRASDLYDLARLLLVEGPGAASVAAMPGILREVVAARLHTWFIAEAGRDRTFRDVRRFDEPAVDLDDVADAAETLVGSVDG